VRLLATVILVLVPSVCNAYILPAADLLGRMSSHFQRIKTVQVSVTLEDVDGRLLQENLVTVPMRPGEEPADRHDALLAGYLPYPFLTMDVKNLRSILPSLFAGDAGVRFTRLDSTVCYLVEGTGARLWIRKKDLYPLRAEVLTETGRWVTCLYLDPVHLTKRMVYPSRTEVRIEGNLEYIERLSLSKPNAPSP